MRRVVKVGTSRIAFGERIRAHRVRALVGQHDRSRHEYPVASLCPRLDTGGMRLCFAAPKGKSSHGD
jgi:hypothetical protein